MYHLPPLSFRATQCPHLPPLSLMLLSHCISPPLEDLADAIDGEGETPPGRGERNRPREEHEEIRAFVLLNGH